MKIFIINVTQLLIKLNIIWLKIVECSTICAEYQLHSLDVDLTLDDMMEKLEALAQKVEVLEAFTKRIEAVEACCSTNNASIQENRKRHENIDISFNGLCLLIDKIFDVASPPGGTRYDCCYESYTGTINQIGNAMLCLPESFLGISPNPPFPQTGTGACASSCGNLPPN